MIRRMFCLAVAVLLWFSSAMPLAQERSFRVLAFYSDNVEHDHLAFAGQAIQFFEDLAKKDQYDFKATNRWDDLNAAVLQQYQVVLWLNDAPHSEAQRAAFQQYVSHGGAWLGFHAAGYNDETTRWPWFVDFLGGAVFYGNNWPPLPAKLVVDDRTHPVTRRLPPSFTSPANEWYLWKPSPRLSQDVRVLVTLAPDNYPLGFKDVIVGGDLPVVWTNVRYRMLYINMGHGDKIFTSTQQNEMLEDALLWLGVRR
jgi:type 1 glutamine amidotransferase